MEQGNKEAPALAIFYEDRLPLAWRAVVEGGSSHEQIDEGNAEFLRIVASLEDHPPRLAERPSEAARDLLRLEFKLDLLLEIVSRMAARHLEIPAAVSLRLSARGIEWVGPDSSVPPPPPGARILVDLYLRPDLPRPLVLPARVAAVKPEGSVHRVVALFEPLHENLQDWLERTIFRHHRRQVQERHRTSAIKP